jgi:hypothetical protein
MWKGAMMDAKELNLQGLEKGKYGEFLVFGELLKRGADLYLPVIDRGVDAIVRKRDRNRICLEIQIKTTETYNQAGYFNVYDLDDHPTDRFFIVCVDLNKQNVLKGETWPNIWIVSATEFRQFMTSGHLLPIYERSRKHNNEKRDKLLAKTFKAWNCLTG